MLDKVIAIVLPNDVQILLRKLYDNGGYGRADCAENLLEELIDLGFIEHTSLCNGELLHLTYAGSKIAESC